MPLQAEQNEDRHAGFESHLQEGAACSCPSWLTSPVGTAVPRSLRDVYPFLTELPQIEMNLGSDLRQECDVLRQQTSWPDLAMKIAACAMEVSDRPLGELIPELTESYMSRMPTNLLQTRSRNILLRRCMTTWSDLTDLSPEDLAKLSPENVWQLPNAGHGTVLDIVRMCVLYAGDGHTMGRHTTEPGSEPDVVSQSPQISDGSLFAMAKASQQLRSIAAWALRERPADEARAVWQLRPELNAPPFILAAWEDFLATPLLDLADEDLLHEEVDKLVEELLGSFEPNNRAVLQARILSTEPMTLAEVGGTLGVSRARVGQIQKIVEKRLTTLLNDRRFLPLQWRAGDLAQALGAAAPVGAVRSKQALQRAARDCTDQLASTFTSLLLHLAGSYTVRDGWYVRRGSKVPDARELESLADDHGLLSMHAAEEWLTLQSVDPTYLEDLISLSGRFKRLDDRLAVWSGSVVDKCVSMLAFKGAPADAETLVTEVGEGHNVRGVRTRFFQDPRLMRTNRNEWGLRSWQLEEYTGIAEEITQRIESWGGRAKITDLVDELVRVFGVNANSVRLYAEAPMFITEGGYVRLSRGEEGFIVNHDLSGCRGVFQISKSSLSYLIAVDRDVLRGSGRKCPDGLAAALGVSPGKSRSFSTGGGQLTVYWPETSALGPSLGSTRALVTDAGGVEGDLIRLQFEVDRGECLAFRISLDALTELIDKDAISALTGLQDLGEDLAAAVSRSVGTDSARLIEVLRQRGDDMVANLLPAARVDDALKDALSDLAGVLGDLT